MINARTAKASDFDSAAQKAANAFWLMAILTGFVWWFASFWWAIIPGLIGLWFAVQSVSATRAAGKLRAGTYPIPNPNNGLPD